MELIGLRSQVRSGWEDNGMTTLPLPKVSSEISAAWLNRVLGDAGVMHGAAITGFAREVIGEGAGFVGELSRITLRYNGSADRAPRSVIAKLPTSDDMIRTIALLFGFYEREHRFYAEVADEVELRVPRCYYNAMDAPAGSYVLLLEDLAPARCGDQLASCSMDDAKLALGEIAKFHAAWWNSPRLQSLAWMPSLGNSELRELLHSMYQQSWPAFAELYKDELPEPIMAIGEAFGAQFNDLAALATERPQTLIHTDFRLDNMFFGTEGGEDSFILIDWQLVQQGVGPLDVAYFLAGNFPREVRRAHETELLEHYHRTLTEHGVAGYSLAECVEDYRRAMLILLLFIVPSRENLNVEAYGERGQALLNVILERYVAAILDVDAGAFLAG